MSDFYTVKGEDLSNLANDLREASGQNEQLTWPNGFRSAAQASSQSSLPTGGTAGQVLQKTANGAEWADKDLYIVHYNRFWDEEQEAIGEWTCDHTLAEITTAYNAGKFVVAKIHTDRTSAGGDDEDYMLPLAMNFFGNGFVYGVTGYMGSNALATEGLSISFMHIMMEKEVMTLSSNNQLAYVPFPSSNDVGKVPVVNDIDGNVVWKDNPTNDFIVATYTEHEADDEHTNKYWTCDKTYAEIHNANGKIIGIIKGIDNEGAVGGYLNFINGEYCYTYLALYNDKFLATLAHFYDNTITDDFHSIVKTVGGNAPDNNGNVAINLSGFVKNINGYQPDAAGTVNFQYLESVSQVDNSILFNVANGNTSQTYNVEMPAGIRAINTNSTTDEQMRQLISPMLKSALTNTGIPQNFSCVMPDGCIRLLQACASYLADGVIAYLNIQVDTLGTIFPVILTGAHVQAGLGHLFFKDVTLEGKIRYKNSSDNKQYFINLVVTVSDDGSFYLTITATDVNYTPIPTGKHTTVEVIKEIEVSVLTFSYDAIITALESGKDFSIPFYTSGFDSNTDSFTAEVKYYSSDNTYAEIGITYDNVPYYIDLTLERADKLYSLDLIYIYTTQMPFSL